MLRLAIHCAALLLLSTACPATELIVLGIAQDAGVPQLGCTKPCCAAALADPALALGAASIAIVDGDAETRWLIDATPNLPSQLALLDRLAPAERDSRDAALDGIFLTHAHMGHYTGLMHLGREAMSSSGVRVYTLPRMAEFLRDNGPWSQLCALGNIVLEPLDPGAAVSLGPNLGVQALLVPHRDEFSETAGFLIRGPQKSALYIPDIDKWEQWTLNLPEILSSVDLALVDGTFFDASELPGRSADEIPHPLMVETLALVRDLPASERAKLYFIHLNHSNPALRADGPERELILEMDCHIAQVGERFAL
jgi:pyrroloquinoline quinone biosynthesis protein B